MLTRVSCISLILAFAIFCTVPFIMVVSSSLTSEDSILQYGYNLFPRKFDVSAYRYFLSMLKNHKRLQGFHLRNHDWNVRKLAHHFAVAYPIALKRVKYRTQLNVFTLITILISGGIVPWYIVCIKYLHLQDNLFALIVPYLCQAWNVFLLRSYFQNIPEELSESAKIDGAGEYRIFFQMIVPLSKPALATVGLFIALAYWNDWWLGLMLLNKVELQPLQPLLRTIQSNVEFLATSEQGAEIVRMTGGRLPGEGLKMATAVITIGPIIFVYPFVQRFFIKGLMIGAVKG